MSMALLLALLLPAMQDDPQLAYREGLFEEVDQGNLDKAVEHYAKVLKSGAPDALKAKALLRTGFCHEKKGKKKEAEQAWRDVIERYPSAAETIKLAQERLNRNDGATVNQTSQAHLEKLILDLGAYEEVTRHAARRSLHLLFEASYPLLKKALLHPDRILSNNAAAVLVWMNTKDDPAVYESIRRFWNSSGDPSGEDLEILPRLLKDDGIRARFLKDVQDLRNTSEMPRLSAILCKLKEPGFSGIVEDWIAGSPEADWDTLHGWSQERPPSDILRLMKRLGAAKPPNTVSIIMLFLIHAETATPPNAELKTELLSAMKRESDPKKCLQYLSNLVPHVDASALVRGPLASWFARSDGDRREVMDALEGPIPSNSEPAHDALRKEYRKFLFEQMSSPETALEIKEELIARGYAPETEDERKKNLEFCLQYWRERRGQLEPAVRKEGRASVWQTMNGIIHQLLAYLPADSKDLPQIMDDSFEFEMVTNGPLHDPEKRTLYLAAAMRCIAKDSPRSHQAMNMFQHATPDEKRGLGPLLPGLRQDALARSGAKEYALGVHGAPEDRRESVLGELKSIYPKLGDSARVELIRHLSTSAMGWLDDIMRDAWKSADPNVRLAALSFWSYRDSEERMRFIEAALKDPAYSGHLQQSALATLGLKPSLELVPEVIKLLNSPHQHVRKQAEATLAATKKHFEAQAEWQRWYDETRKALNK